MYHTVRTRTIHRMHFHSSPPHSKPHRGALRFGACRFSAWHRGRQLLLRFRTLLHPLLLLHHLFVPWLHARLLHPLVPSLIPPLHHGSAVTSAFVSVTVNTPLHESKFDVRLTLCSADCRYSYRNNAPRCKLVVQHSSS